MKRVIYYFSATGNSLTTAKMLAAEMGACEIVSVASLDRKAEITVQAEMVGFVFPIYYSDMPYLMRSCIRRMQFTGDPYIFSVCTCRGHYGDVAQRLEQLLQSKGQHLSCSLHIPMPGNSRLSTPEENAVVLAAQSANVQAAAQKLKAFPKEDYGFEEAPKPSPVHVPSNMRGLSAEETCVGCGICQKVCPMENIHLTDGSPVIGENCISCLTCFHWCPQEAIWMSEAEETMKRRFKYHHPNVTLADILNQKK